MANQVTNLGRIINFITGITGVQAGGQAIVNMPVNARYHRLTFQCSAVNYTGGTALATLKITGAGNNDATTTLTVVNGVITAAAVVAGGTGYVTGDIITPVDATGTGARLTVTAAAGAVTALAVTVGGTASPINPASLVTGMKLLVNGVNMRDIIPANILKIAIANGYLPTLGELPVFFTEPWRNLLGHNETTSWDTFGQATFQLQISIAATVSLPNLVGVQEFDYQRNARPSTTKPGTSDLFLQPVSQHQFSWPIVAGRNDINNLPFSYPISRLWIYGTIANQITQLEIYQDNNKVFEATEDQLKQMFKEYGFQFGQPNFVNSNWSTSAALQGAYVEPIYFDSAFISDPDQRVFKALACANSFVVRVYSAQAQAITFVMEMLPGQYSS